MSTALIDDSTLAEIRERLAGSLVGPVELRLHRPPAGAGCDTCEVTEDLARALAGAAPEKISLLVTEVTGSEDATIPVPTLTVGVPGEEARIAFQGAPAGYEFAALLDGVERVSAASPAVAAELADALTGLDRDAEVMVFVTPNCPYCPGAASMANRFDVQGVPRTIVIRAGSFTGAVPEKRFVQSVLRLARAGATGGELP